MGNIVHKRKTLQFKAEATPGTAETTGFSAINTYDFDVKPDVGFESVPGMSGFGPVSGIATTRAATVTFSFDVTVKSAAGATWMGLLAGCGYVLATGLYSPNSNPPGVSGGGSCFTFLYNQDGRKQVVYGAMGNMVFEATAGGKIKVKATFRGILDTPVDAAIPSITLPSSETIARFASTPVFTIGGTTYAAGRISLDLGAKVELIPSNLTASGFLHAVVADCAATGSFALKSSLNATFRPLLSLMAGTTFVWVWTVGAVGNGITFNAPVLQISKEPDVQEINGVAYDIAEFMLMRSAAAGDDFLTIDPTA